jgi:hypothetical protein
MGENGDHHVKQNKLSQRQVSPVYSHIWNLGAKRHENKRGLLRMWKGKNRRGREDLIG